MKREFNLSKIAVVDGSVQLEETAGTITTESLDRKHYLSGIFHLQFICNVDDMDLTITLEHSDDDSAWVAVPDAMFKEVVELEDGDEENLAFEVPLNSLKRYTRIKIVAVGSGNVDVAATYVMGDAEYIPNAKDFLEK